MELVDGNGTKAQDRTLGGGFLLSDFGYDPKYEWGRAKALDVENLNPDPVLLQEHKEFFGQDGWLERSRGVDYIGGQIHAVPAAAMGPHGFTILELMAANRRYAFGVTLPSTEQTVEFMKKVYPARTEQILGAVDLIIDGPKDLEL